MGRKPRIHFPGACYHVIVRGNNRQSLFFSDADRDHFLALVGEGVERFGHQVHAYCLMFNHAHFAMQVDAVPLSKIVHSLCFRYARRIHRRLRRSGHLFERRYRAGLINNDRSLQMVVRYIHRNPVEAGMAEEPSAYSWSSHRRYLRERKPSWLTTGLVLGLFGHDEIVARRQLAGFVASRSDPGTEPWEPERLLTDVENQETRRATQPARLGSSLEKILKTVVQVAGVSLAELAAPTRRRPVARARAMAALIVRDHTDLSLRELADRLQRSAATMSCLASRWDCLPGHPGDELREEIRRCLGVLRTE